MNQTEYAALRGKSVSWVSRQIKLGMPARGDRQGSDYEIDPRRAFQWEIDRARKAARATPQSLAARLDAARLEKLMLANAARCGELMITAEVRNMFNAACAQLVGTLQGIPARVAKELVGKDENVIVARLNEELRRARSTFADQLDAEADHAQRLGEELAQREGRA